MYEDIVIRNGGGNRPWFDVTYKADILCHAASEL